ncbi:FAD-dependent oxidoreductase [Sphingomonas xinjiangensis]|uniref:Calx-beta domain-containing protein n=1 Tax=Sphingomonas xinjiangensis TaxID=643568 RepID=A0A840Y7R5_9SPHN|nr:FAD-dependent oxidoreductase [Sphingomonas xinjiangensis]MBB5709337.1 hypothetical protein [Sphingomonas xinjiangensis]
MLQVDAKYGFTLAAGEPFLFEVQFKDGSNNVLDLSDREFVLSFYRANRTAEQKIDGEARSDVAGPRFEFVRDGSFSESLYANRNGTIELAERLKNGKSVIFQGKYTITESAPGVLSYGNTVIGRDGVRLVLVETVKGFQVTQSQYDYVAGNVVPEPDTTPDAFSITPVTGAARNTATDSAAFTITGIDTPASWTVAGGTAQVADGAFASSGTVSNGQAMRVRLNSSASYSTVAKATLTVGGVSADFSVTTAAAPVVTPSPTLSLSAPVTVSESNSGTTAFTWTLTLNRDGSTAAYPYSWAVAGSGANPANAADFGGTFPSGSGTFAAGETVKTITVLASGDTAVEPDDTFTLTVTAAGLNTVTSTGTIGNDDSTPVDPTLPTYTLSAQTTSAVSAMQAKGYTPAPAYQRFMDNQFKRLAASDKHTPVLTDLSQLWVAHPGDALTNLVSPGTLDPVKVGALTWTSPVAGLSVANPLGNVIGYSTGADTAYIDTTVGYGTLTPGDATFGFYKSYSPVGTVGDMGVADGTGGAFIVAQSNNNSSTFNARVFSAALGVTGTAADWHNTNWHAVRSGADGIAAWHNAKKVATKTGLGTVAPTNGALTIRQLMVNGFSGHSAAGHLAGFVAKKALTDPQMRTLYRVVRSWVEEVIWGSVNWYDPGFAPEKTNYDVICYGFTIQSVMAALEAKRQGLDVAMVGGWNETSRSHIGGMSANGLGEFDVDHPETVGGLMRTMIVRARAIDGATDTTLKFNPGSMNKVLRQALAQAGIPMYATGAMPTACSRSNGVFTLSIGDGRTFTSTFLEDNSYEGDAIALLPVPTIFGRQAAGTGTDALDGFRGSLSANGGNINQFATNPTGPGALWNIDPFIVPGDINSGPLPFVAGPMPNTPVGIADTKTQSFNFRQTWTNVKANQIPWDQFFNGVPPEGYSAANYEAIGRQAALMTAAGVTMALRECMKVSTLYKGKTDVNNQGGLSTDMMGSGTAYVAAGRSAAGRLQVLKNVRNYILGLIYYILYSGDARLPTSMVTALQAYGWPDDHYNEPGVNDIPNFPGCLYVREYNRMAGGIGGAFWTGNDATAADGQTPRVSARTVAAASYALDSHHMERYYIPINAADLSQGYKLWLEGNMFSAMGGANGWTPVPAEITMPDASVMPNLATAWSVAGNHVMFGTYRMEGCSGQTAQMHGLGMAVAKTRGVTLQDAMTTYYSDVVALAQATPDAVKPFIPATT